MRMFGKRHILSVSAVVFSVFALAPVAGAATKTSAVLTLLQDVNRTRVAHHLRPLRVDGTLVRAAQSHSSSMLAGNYFAHGDFHGRMVAFHVVGPVAGENLAWGSGDLATPRAMVRAWMQSAEHRANLLDRHFADVGIGVAPGAPVALEPGELGGTYVTDFGRRLKG